MATDRAITDRAIIVIIDLREPGLLRAFLWDSWGRSILIDVRLRFCPVCVLVDGADILRPERDGKSVAHARNNHERAPGIEAAVSLPVIG